MERFPYYALALLLAAALALSGCVLFDQDGNPIDPANDKFSAKALVVPKYVERIDLVCKELDDDKPCYCVTCKNNTGLTGMLKDNYDHTLVGGTCEAVHCDQEDYTYFVNESKDIEMRSFMLGSGQSLVSSGNANLFCNYTLQLATKWMKGAEGNPPVVPMESRAYCWLGRGMLPLYIYYTGGQEIDPGRTAQIAQKFNAGNVGPAIITTEAGWDGTDSDAVGKVKAQLVALQECDKCIKVLAIKPNDYKALYAILGVPGLVDPYFLERVDAVGFGFRANDYPHCDVDRIIYENVNFSSYILQKYNKPSIWLYVGASEGNSSIGDESTGGCVWDKARVSNLYSELMARTGELADNGVMGMSLYEFVDGSGPIPCNDVQGCDFGMLSNDGSQKHPQLNTWSEMCQEVNVRSEARKPLIFSRNGQGTACGEINTLNAQALLATSSSIGTLQGLSMEEIVPADKIADMGCGEVCPENTTMEKSSIYDNTGHGFNSGHCGSFPIIDEYADDWDVSATYFRAIVEQESAFDPYAVSCVDADNSCNPQGYTMEQICELAGNDPLCQTSMCTGTNPDTGMALKPCAYGLAQCIEYPGKHYVDNGIPIPDAISQCGGEKYNPFNPAMSGCCGAGKFAQFLRYSGGIANAENFIKNNWGSFKARVDCLDGIEEKERGWAAYYLASNMYNGEDWDYISEFEYQRPCDGGVGLYDNYIEYLRNTYPDTDYGAQVMSRYRSAVTACKSDCPK